MDQNGVHLQFKNDSAGFKKSISVISENELKLIIKENYPDLYTLQSVPRIGASTAAFLITLAEGFDKFESAKQLICYVGLSPTNKNLGSSVKGSTKISKQAFAIAKSGFVYDENYRSVPPYCRKNS